MPRCSSCIRKRLHGLSQRPCRFPGGPIGLPPIAPAWRDIAIKYRDDPGASDRLRRTVMTGTGPNSRHWAGKVSAVNMPPNAAVISDAEARVLVNWILVLVP